MLKIIYSNDLTQLSTRLAEVQQSQPLPALEAETIIVQSNELARWLSLFLAGQHGIASHIDFPYPSAYIWALFRRLLPEEIPQQSPFSTDAMTWRIFELLPECRRQAGFESIDAYLGQQDDTVKRYELAHRIADSFDQYLMYRPDWVQAWEQGETPHWQARLWQRLTKGDAKPWHRANLLLQLKHYLSSTETRPIGLPSRIAIFGLSALPPVYLELFELMARHCDIYLFFLSPSEQYWGDLLNPKTQSKKQLESPEQEQYLATGHPLLASLGKQGQDFFNQLQYCTPEEEFLFSTPQQNSLLEKLHYDIYALTDIDSLSQKKKITADDDSIMVHSCHSAMREIEVLHDQLLAFFERHPELSPTDVVVMTSNIEKYSPWIDAVFDSQKGMSHNIPYSIADGGIKSQSLLLTAFTNLLGLPQSRFDVDSIVSLLECEAIQNRFSFDQQQLALIRRWLRETHTAWGLSADDKVSLDLPANDANTWRAGLDRLLLGYAMSESSASLFEGRLGFEGISSDRAETMAQLCAFIDTLDRYRQRLKAALTTRQWQKLLIRMLEVFFVPSSANSKDEAELLLIRKTLDSLVATTELAVFEKKISIDLVKAWFDGHLDTQQTQMRFMGNGVTFCGMVPMRSIPFKVVCLIGMNDGDYPRRQATSGLDLMSQTPKRQGDRSQRDEDRYLFLESLLSAQSHFYISYVGASIVDNSAIPPSVLVSDVRDVLKLSFESSDGGDIWQHVLTEHPLQAFSRRYFDGSSAKLFSYATSHCPVNRPASTGGFFDKALPEPDQSWKTINLAQLLSFYRHPARFLSQQRLGLWLEPDEEQLETREPFDLNGLQAWSLRQQLLAYRLNDKAIAEALPLIQATGVLPQGSVGDIIFNEQTNKVEAFADKLLPYYPDAFLTPLPFQLALNGFVLQGQLEGLTSGGLFSFRMAKSKGGELVTVWLQHLILNCIQPANVVCESRWITDDKDYHFKPVENAQIILSELLELYWQGLQQPLPLFSNTSYAYAKASLKGGRANPEKAMFAAWQGNMKLAGEKEDLYYQQVYDYSPLDDEFKRLALSVYEPLQAHLYPQSFNLQKNIVIPVCF